MAETSSSETKHAPLTPLSVELFHHVKINMYNNRLYFLISH